MPRKPKFQLSAENYYSPDAKWIYMSSTQIKSFLDCEARAVAELNGEYVQEQTDALLVGSFVDAHFSGELDKFKEEHPEIFKQRGGLRAEFVQAEQIIRRIESDPLFMLYMEGEKQVIKTGTIAGVPFKIKIDNYMPGKAIVDLKVVKDFKPIYKEGEGRLSFIEAWLYDMQGAIYQAVEGNSLPFIIAAATKEKVTDLALIQVPQHYLDASLQWLEYELPHIIEVKEGKAPPRRCEKCDYCKQTKRLTHVIMLDDFFVDEYDGGEFDQ